MPNTEQNARDLAELAARRRARELPPRLFAQKRNDRWVLVEYTGNSRASVTNRLWPNALITPRKPRTFDSIKEATDWALANGAHG